MTKRGRFITFEGIDGAGKSTQMDRLQALLESHQIEVIRTREPGGTPIGEKIRALLLNEAMDPMTETLLFFASRAEHIKKVIEPALSRGAWVFSDRFTDSTYAYQVGGRYFPGEKVEALEAWTQEGLTPDKTLLFDLPPEVAAERMKGRVADRFEMEPMTFVSRVREAYLSRARRQEARFVVIDATDSEEKIATHIQKVFAPWL